MVWTRASLVFLSTFTVALACGPAGVTGDGGTETDTDTDTDGTADSTGGPSTVTSPTVGMTQGQTGSTTTDPPMPTTSTTDPPSDTSGDTTGSPPVDTGECPFGAEGCLCDVGSTCDDGLECVDGTCVAPPECEPIDTDPHGDEASATDLPDTNCGQNMDLGVVATLWGPELDWFSFFGNDSFGCIESPTASVVATEPLQVCVYIECTSGADATNIDCGGDMDATSPDGRPGCCGIDTVTMADYDCGFGGKDVDVYVSVGSGENICVDYELSIGF